MKVSIVTASFNSASTIADTLKSVAAQTHSEIEHFVIDGGSIDRTSEIVRELGGPDLKFVSEPDDGIYDAMNKGLAMATGEVVGLLNSDDFYPSADVIAKVAAAFAVDSQLDAVYGDLCYVKQNQPDQVVRYWRSSAFRPGLFRTGWCPPHPTFFARRSVYERLGGFDLSYRMANDIELMARFIEVHRVKTQYLPELLVKMRMGGASNRNWSAVLLQNREIWRAMKTHQMGPSLLPFVVGKLLSRGRQFLTRPA